MVGSAAFAMQKCSKQVWDVCLKVQLNARTSSILFGVKTGFDNVDIKRTVTQRS